MTESRISPSFHDGWWPVGHSPSVLHEFFGHLEDFVVTSNCHYFKPIDSFDVPALQHEGANKFEDIDSFIVEEFGCDFDDIITLNSVRYGPVIVMPRDVLTRAGVNLPQWREPPRPPVRARMPQLVVVRP
jgi:hypothetical protein